MTQYVAPAFKIYFLHLVRVMMLSQPKFADDINKM